MSNDRNKTVFGSLKAGIAAGATLTIALLLPITASAQEAAKLTGSLGVANVTAGNTKYKQAVDGSVGQTVKVHAYYVNNEVDNSKKSASNVRMKITLPTVAGKSQSLASSVKADNTDAVVKRVTVNTGRDDVVLQYIPGSAVWKHNAGTAKKPKIVETNVSDDVVVGAQGIVLETQKPGEVYAASVSVLARLATTGVKVTAQSQLKSETNKWSIGNTANPGDTMRYIIGYQNTSNSQQKTVIARTVLPANATIVPGTTILTNATNPSGIKFDSDAVATSGIVIGTYAAGANAFVTFEAILPTAERLACGDNRLQTVSVVKPEGSTEYYGSNVTNIKRNCEATSTPKQTTPSVAPPATPSTPVTPTPPSSPAPASPPAPATPTAPPAAPGALPNSGTGEMVGLFAAVAIAGAIAHRMYLARRLSNS